MRQSRSVRYIACLVVALVALAWAATPTSAQRARRSGARRAATPAPPRVALTTIIEASCGGCHNGRMRAPTGQVLESFDVTQVASNPDPWARAYRHLQAGTMPPAGAPRPDRAVTDAALAAMEQALGAALTPAARAGSQQIATRLAAVLWNSEPDAALQLEVRRNRLTDSAVLEREVRRMLADDRAAAFVQRFFFPWLALDTLAAADPDAKYFPDFDGALRDAFARETELFLLSQLRDDGDPSEIWSADYTFVNERLARHYGMAPVAGEEFRRVPSTPERAGLLGHASVLTVTSRHQHGVDAGYTTPATRAKWVLTRYLGVPTPSPFPGAQPVKPELPITPQTRALPASPCVNCHRNFFPLGYALEHFDPIGRWRTRDEAGPVDASVAFVDGTTMTGPADLRAVLLQRPDAFRTTVTEALLTFTSNGASGPVTLDKASPATLVRARQILRGMPKPRWSALIAAVVAATPATP